MPRLIRNILKSSLILLLTGLIVFQLSKDVVVLAWYQLNQDAITQAYCVNLNTPEMMCNAKCHLTKILSLNSSNQQNSQIVLTQLPSVNYILEPQLIFDVSNRDFQFQRKSPGYHEPFFKSLSNGDIFHPPRV